MVNYVLRSLLAQRVPFYSDALSAIELIDDHGSYAMFLVALGWGLQLSIIASCILLLRRNEWARRLVWAQLPLRLFLFAPSATVLFAYSGIYSASGSMMLIALVVVSELAKVWSLWFFREAR
ncbi:hypothetical protein [Pseudomonas xanthosomatis]|uniref:hypothetical protein n=1 Tax=Pseudomonas xanthosomatis TaxID=2842356 RepID=UPI003518E8E8